MLLNLTVSNYTLLQEADIDWQPGFTVVTGQTGAGKSVLLGALLLCLGLRAGSDLVRPGAKQLSVCATFDTDDTPSAAQWLRDNDLPGEDAQCIMRRLIGQDGRSRCTINGTPVTVQQLATLGGLLVEVHGQHAQQTLLGAGHQARLLDSYAGLDESLIRLGEIFARWRAAAEALEAARNNRTAGEQRQELLRFQLQELDELALQPGEWQQIDDELRRAQNIKELGELVQGTLTLLDEHQEQPALGAIAQAERLLGQAAAHDETLGETAELLAQAHIHLDEASRNLRHYRETLEIEPTRLEWLESRVSRAHDLARKHAIAPDELPVLHQQLREELEILETQTLDPVVLQERLQDAREAWDQLAAKITDKRRRAAKSLAQRVNETLASLGMTGGRFQVILDARETLPDARGSERAQFALSVGEEAPKPLGKIASGGELSRISLAVQLALQAQEGAATLVFDEVDVGVGGAVAEIIGQLLHKLGKDRQIIAITHLPQVAAQGDHHLLVSKSVEQTPPMTRVAALDSTGRTEELTRMLGGVELTDTARAHARDLLARQDANRATGQP